MNKAKYSATAQCLINACQAAREIAGVVVVMDNASMPRVCSKMSDPEFDMFRFTAMEEGHVISLKEKP